MTTIWEDPERSSGKLGTSPTKGAYVDRTSDRLGTLTPEMIGEWLVEEQRVFLPVIVKGALQEREDCPPLELSPESLFEIAYHGYALQVALVAFSYQPILDDSRYFSGGEHGTVDIEVFLRRIQAGAQVESRKHLSLEDQIREGKSLDLFAVAGCALEFGEVLRDFIRYYGAFFTPLDSLPATEGIEFAAALVRLMQTSSPLAPPAALAYSFGFERELRGGDPSDETSTILRQGCVTLRTWGVWMELATTFQKRLIAFERSRTVDFD